jgi:hypothetical protein
MFSARWPAQLAARAVHLPPAAQEPLPGGPLPASCRRPRHHPLPFLFCWRRKGKAARAGHGAVATRPRGLPSHRRRPRTPRPAAISSRRRRLWNSPTLAARGKPIPCSPTRSRRRGGRRGRGGSQEQRRHRGAIPAPPPRRRSCPRGGAGPAGAANAFDLGPLDFLAAEPLCGPYQRRLPPLHSTARRHRRLHFGQRPPR